MDTLSALLDGWTSRAASAREQCRELWVQVGFQAATAAFGSFPLFHARLWWQATLTFAALFLLNRLIHGALMFSSATAKENGELYVSTSVRSMNDMTAYMAWGIIMAMSFRVADWLSGSLIFPQ